MKFILIFFMTALLLKVSVAQDRSSEVIGKPFPDLIFDKVLNSNENSIKISDYRGKIIIVDFWATWCGPCIASLPKLQKIQNTYGDKVKVILISNEKKAVVEKFLKQVKKEWSIDLPSVVEDSIANKIFKHKYIPYTLIIGKDGNIKAVPHSEDLTIENINSLLQNQTIKIAVNEDVGKRKNVDFNKPILQDTSYGLKSTYYCMFSSYNLALGGIISILPNIDSLKGGKITILNTSIPNLYSVAYGSFVKRLNGYPERIPSFRIEIESKDSLKMRGPKTSEIFEWMKKNYYCFEYTFPKRNLAFAHSFMIQQLDDYFGYKSSMEKREVECFVIRKISDDADKLKTKGGSYDYTDGVFLTKMTNAPLGNFINHLEFKYWAKFKKPIIDETGLSDNIDLKLETDITSIEKVSKSLRSLGLEIISEKRLVDFVIIRDK